MRRVRPRAGAYRSRVGEGLPGEVPGVRRRGSSRTRAVSIKEERADLVKHHLWVLWTDYFKPEHLEKHPNLHDLFWNATKEAGAAKKSDDPAQGQKLLDSIDEIAKVFWETKS